MPHYAAHVAADTGIKLCEAALAQQTYLGDQDFVGRMQALVDPARATATNIPVRQRLMGKPIQNYLDRASVRHAGIYAAATEGHHSLTAIAKVVGYQSPE